MYRAIAALMQGPESGKNELTPCQIIHSFLLLDVIYMSARGKMAKFKHKERQHKGLELGFFFFFLKIFGIY